MAEGFHVASAYLTVSPDTDGFAEELKAQLEKYDFKFTVPVRPDTAGFMAEAEADIRAQSGGDGIEVPVSPDAGGFGEKLQAAVDAGEAGVRGNPVDVPVDPDVAEFDEKLAAAIEQARVFVTDSGGVTVPVYADASLVSFERVQATAQLLADAHPVTLPVKADPGALAGVEALTAATDALGASTSRAYGIWGALGTQIPLFSGQGVFGIMRSVAAWHLLADVAVEFSAVAIPALVATGAFGIAAAGDIGDMYTHFQNVLTVTDAMRENMAPLTGGLTAMQNAVKPEVYQLAGEGIDAMSKKLGIFQQLATGTGTVLDQLGARATVAFGAGMDVFLKNAVNDLRELGNIGANVFGIIGNLLKSMPGYAQPLENVVQGLTGALETVTSSGITQGAIKLGLGFHGAAIYIGLAATAAAKLVSGGLTALSRGAQFAAERIGGMGTAGEAAAGGLSRFGIVAADAAALPWGWILAAAAGVAFLAYRFVEAGDAADGFNAKINAAVAAAPLAQTLTAINDGLSQTRERLTSAASTMSQFSGTTLALGKAVAPVAPALNDIFGPLQRVDSFINEGLNQGLKDLGLGFIQLPTGIQATGAAAAQAAHDFDAYKNEVATLNTQSITFRSHLAGLAVQFGGTAQAMGILTAAGITSKQMTSTSAASWAQVMAQVQATTVAYKDMGQTGGVLGADMNALDIAASEQATAMSKVNQAWDTTIGIISGGQNAFITFQQDLLSVNQAVAGTGGTGRVVTDTFSAAEKAAKAAGASMTGLNAASLQLRSTWQSAYGGASTLIDSLRMMSSVSPGGFPSITKAMKDSIAELIPFGAQSAATRSELVALAQEINPNITNFQQLTQWVGNTKDAGSNLNKIVAQMGGNLQDLEKDAGSLSASMANDVTAQFDAAKLAANGTDTAIQTLAQAMSKQGATARSEHPAMVALYNDLLKDGFGAKDAQSMIEAMTGQIFKIPTSHTTKITADTAQALSATQYLQAQIDALHGKTVDITEMLSVKGAPVPGLGVTTGAVGGVIPGYAPGRDIVRALLSPGEGVLVPEAVRGLGGAQAINALNRRFGGPRVARGNKTGGFASGGITASSKFTYPNDEFIFNISNPVTLPRGWGSGWQGGATTINYGALGKELLGTGGGYGKFAAQYDASQRARLDADMRNAGIKLADAFADGSLKTAAEIKSESLTAIRTLEKYYSGPAATRLENAIKGQTTAMEKLATASAKVSATIAAMKNYASGITSNLASSYSSLSSLPQATDANGNPIAPTGSTIASELAAKLSTLKKFFTAIGTLKKDKVDKSLIAQVIALGPDEGLEYAQAIIAGGASLIKELNSLESGISSEETKIGQRAADIQYGQSISKGFLKGLDKEEAALKKKMDDLGREIAKELAKALGVPLKDVAGLTSAKKTTTEKKKTEKASINVTQNFNGVQNLTKEQLRQISSEVAHTLAIAP